MYVHAHAALPALAVFLTLAPGIVGSIVAAVFSLHAAMVFPGTRNLVDLLRACALANRRRLFL